MILTVGAAVFALIAVLTIGLELTARWRGGHHATMADMGRWLRRNPLMRWALLVSWAFTGWHFFVR